MPKLHELLAVNNNLATQLEKTSGELRETFEKKRHHFTEQVVTYHPFGEDGQGEVEKKLDLQTTVPSELAWISDFIVKAFDVSHQINVANTQAKADVKLEGQDDPLLVGVPAETLLQLEKRLVEVQNLITAAPTLDPAKGFRPDPDRGKFVYKAFEDTKTRTKKTKRAIVLYDATKEHPAQTQLIDEDVPVGKIITHEWSGMITPADKADMLARVETLIRAVKQARSRANDIDCDVASARMHVGRRLMDFILGNLKA
jgi:hypothetical protein